MAKKFRSNRALFCALAILATIAFIVACGSGIPVDLGLEKDSDSTIKIEDSATKLISVVEDSVETWNYSSEEEEESSSSEEVSKSSSSEEASSTSSNSSSSKGGSSSSSSSPSSNSNQQSSSGNSEQLTCTIKNATVDAGKAVPDASSPTVTCKSGSKTTTIAYDDIDSWWYKGEPVYLHGFGAGLKSGTYTEFEVKVVFDAEACKNEKTTCSGGTLKVGTGVAPSSNSTPSSSSRASSSSSAASSSSRASSSSAASSSSKAQSGSGTHCYYGPGNCHSMPTDDNCENGTLTNDCSSMTTKYCNWGKCENGSGWNCEKGGCYSLAGKNEKTDCTDKYGTVVTTCPAGTKPPSAE